ncbi:MAG TPA: malate dehydrogenase [Actinomycetota bacterium]|jgi:malate dehydrogenase|nr:malate dehydrogenase [Actinomycetota bacterium]
MAGGGKKVTVVGAGNVGSNTARRIAEKDLASEVVMIDIVEGLPQGLALDINQSAPNDGFEARVVGTNDYGDTAGSDVVVITAGLPRKPGMSRMDLLDKNAEIVEGVTKQIVEHSPDTILVVVSNPLDEMTFLASEVSGFPKERVMGMAGVLDSARLRYFIAEKLDVPPASVEALTLGSHGDQMVALPRHAKVQGKPLPELLSEHDLEELFQRTRDGGAEIVGYLKKGSAYYAPSSSAAVMVNAILGDTKEVFPTCAWTTGQYGVSDVYLGVPAKLGSAGVEEIVELELNDDELSKLREAAEAIRSKCRELSDRRS